MGASRSISRSISDDFVPALRTDAPGNDLAVSAALPLTAAAAHLGELELLFPKAADTVLTGKE